MNEMELFKAHRQWATRPDDERFTSLESLHVACYDYVKDAKQKVVPYSDLRVEADKGDVALIGRQGIPAKFTNWAFGQLCNRIGAPTSYMRELPATLACQNMNHGLANLVADTEGNKEAQLMFHSNGSLILRAFTSDRYERIWNHEVTSRILDMQAYGWEVARPDIRVIDQRLPLYASDHDMFAFLRTSNTAVQVKGQRVPVWRGCIWENSEVGAGALKLTSFLYNQMCGNHIIWGASEVVEASVRHIGDARSRWQRFYAVAKKWADASVSDEEGTIERAQSRIIADTKESVLDALFSIRKLGLSRATIAAGYDAVVPQEDGDANTQWGMVQGLTRYSQTVPFADKRTDIDRAAGRLLAEVNF